MKLKYLLVSTCLLMSNIGVAQFQPPQPYGPQPIINEPMPDFSLSDVTSYHKSNVTLKEFRGKWLVLDFWSVTCNSCVRSFPKINKLQEIYKNRMQFLLIGLNSEMGTLGHGKKIKTTYEKLRKTYGLNLTSAYDSTTFIRWSIWTVPFYIVIDPEGNVRSLSNKISEEDIKYMLNNSQAQMSLDSPQLNKIEPQSDLNSQNNNLIYQSTLTTGNGEHATWDALDEYVNKWPEYRKTGLVFKMQPLAKLYQIAYFNTWNGWQLLSGMKYPFPLIESNDSSLFKYDYDSNDFKGLYNYTLIVDPSKSNDLKYIKKIFQQELKNIFNFDVVIEQKSMPVWILTAQEGASSKLKTKGKQKKRDGLQIDVTLTNYSVQDVIKTIWSYHQKEIPIIDETQIKHNIDITIDGSLMEFNQIQTSLQKQGLSLKKGEKTMEVIIIRDLMQ